MARRSSRSYVRHVQAGEPFLGSRALALPRLSALASSAHEDAALQEVRYREFLSGAFPESEVRFPHAKPTFSVRPSRPWSALSMLSPRRVLFCLRRKIRREVMFAIRKNGVNGGRRYRRRQESQYAC